MIRQYRAEDFGFISDWMEDERTHALWCAGRTSYPLSRESFDEFLSAISERNGDVPFVMTDDSGSVDGFFCYSINQETMEGMLKFVMVDPRKRGRGLGREMIRQAVEYAFSSTSAEAVQLMLFDVNERARKCYESAGFTERGRTPDAFAFKGESWARVNMVIKKG